MEEPRERLIDCTASSERAALVAFGIFVLFVIGVVVGGLGELE